MLVSSEEERDTIAQMEANIPPGCTLQVSRLRGHLAYVYFNPDSSEGKTPTDTGYSYVAPWRYADNGVLLSEQLRTMCGWCKLDAPIGAPDPCLGMLPGVTHACCGHGIKKDSYIAFQDGTVIREIGVIEQRKESA